MEDVEIKYIFDENSKNFNDCIIDIFKSYLILNNFDRFDIQQSNVIESKYNIHNHI